MQPYRIGLAALITLLASVSTPLTICTAAVLSAAPNSVPTQQDPRKAQADQLFQQGIAQYQQGQLEAAIESWRQALTIYQQLQDRQRESSVLGNLGAAHLALGNNKKAIEFSEQFLTLAQQMGDRTSQGQALGNLGIAYKASGEYVKAIEANQQALAIMREIGSPQGEAQVLLNLGNAYEALGDYDNAIASHEQSLKLTQQLNDRQGEAIALGNVGAIYATLGDYSQAIEHYEQSLAIAKAIGDQEQTGYILNNLGSAYNIQNDVRKAIEYYQQSLAIAKTVKNRKLEGEALGNLGTAYEDLGDHRQAVTYHEQSLAIMQAIGDPRAEGLALNNLGYSLFSSGNLKEAENKLREAVKVLESLRPGLADAYNVSVFDTQVLTYNLLQQILIASNNPEAALEIAERGRGRAFVELLAQRLSPKAALESKANSQPPTIEQIKQIARTQNATLVEYSLIPEEEFKVQGKQRGKASELWIWVVQPTGKVAFRKVDLKFLGQQQQQTSKIPPPASLEELVNDCLQFLEGPRIRRGEAARKQLYQLLIEPIAEFLPTDPNAPVIFIPQESLFLLPFAALQDAEGRYVIEKHTTLTAPAIQVLDLTHQQQQRLAAQQPEPLQGKDILVVGNPTMPTLGVGENAGQLAPLPGAEREALAIAQLLKTKAFIGDQATEVDIVKQLPQARMIHLATHGLLDDIGQLGVPGAIALAPSGNNDGFLTAGEIFDLNLKAELVVMSACHTGEGKITGDGVIGLSRSLISAGVPSAIVSLWAVPDGPTAELMSEFYRHLQQNPDKAQALRQAMLKTMQQYPEPVNWAAFTLIGEAE